MDMELPHSVNLDRFLFGRYCFVCHINYLLLSSLFLVCNSLFLTLACTSVVLSALSAYRKPKTMTNTAIATDIHQTLDIKLHL